MASAERRKWGRLLSVEFITASLIQLIVMLVSGAIAFQSLKSTVDHQGRMLAEMKANLDTVRSETTTMRYQINDTASANAMQDGQIKTLLQSRDSDRQLLMDMNAKIEVLLDRTNPKPRATP